MANAPHPHAARLLLEYILSDEGQRVMADHDDLPASPRVPVKVVANKPAAGRFKEDVVTPDMTRDNLPKWVAIDHELFR